MSRLSASSILQSAPRTFGLVTFALALAFSASCPAATRYVDASAVGANNGSSWSDAYTSLQSALTAAIAGDEIWVAAGTYKPAGPGAARSSTFQLKNGVAVFGGFPAGGGSFAQRDPDLFITTLSGDLNGDDAPNFVNIGDNTYHVVAATDLTLTTALDGFVITAGNADSTGTDGNGGGARFSDNDQSGPFLVIRCTFIANRGRFGGGGASFQRGEMQVVDCRFEGNETTGNSSGGGALCTNGATLFQGCEFVGNSAGIRGGGLMFSAAVANASVVGCVFENNTAGWSGGGMAYDFATSSNLTFTLRDCIFRNNSTPYLGSDGGGGGLTAKTSNFRLSNCEFIGNSAGYRGGGALIVQDSIAAVANCIFRGNTSTAARGGGLHIKTSGTRLMGCEFVGNSAAQNGGAVTLPECCPGNAHIINCTIAYNTSAQNGGGLDLFSNNVTVANSIVWGNSDSTGSGETAQIRVPSPPLLCSYSIVQGWTGSFGGTGNNGSDPQFIDADGADNIFGNDDDDLRLPSGSPAVDSGDNAAIPLDLADVDNDANFVEQLPLDVAGLVRRQDDAATADTGSGAAPIVDRGAHELGLPAVVRTYIGPSGGNWFTPRNWTGGVVPDAQSNVIINGHVQIAQSGALASDITILDGGLLAMIGTGGLTSTSIIVGFGGTLSLSSQDAMLEVGSIHVLSGGSVQWTGGTIVINAGGWTQASGISVGCVTPATLDVRGGAPINAPSVQVCAQGLLTGRGVLSGNLTNDGVVAPGDPTGVLSVAGAYTQTATASLLMELGGYTRGGDYDTLEVTGPSSVAGTLDVSLRPGFNHVVGGTHTLITSGSPVQIAFSTTTLPSLPDTAEFIYQQLQPGAACSLFTMISQTGARLYVNANGPAGGNGQDWATSVPSLRSALAIMNAFPGTVDEIWMAQGTYSPYNDASNVLSTFTIPVGAEIYGGFKGNETSLQQRDWIANPTILSGDRFGDDGPDFLNRVDNVLTVVTIFGIQHDNSTVLDGLTIQGGNARGTSELATGGGLKIIVGRPAIRNCTFTENEAVSIGGGVSTTGGASFHDCRFIGNRSSNRGGGLYASSVAAIQVMNCEFDSNIAGYGGASSTGDGGGMWIGSSEQSTVVGCTLQNNSAIGIQNGGGGAWASNTSITDCLFASNEAREGGGALFLVNAAGNSAVNNCTFTGNIAGIGGSAGRGGAILVWSGSATLSGCTFSQNEAGQGSAAYLWSPGSLYGDSDFASDSEVWNSGIVSPGAAGLPGRMEIDGVYRQVNVTGLNSDVITGTLLIELGGAKPVIEHDVLDVSRGSVVLEGGMLQVDLINNFVPAIGQQFTIIPAGQVTGRFDIATMPALTQGLFANLTQAAEGIQISVEELTSLISLGLDSVVPLSGAPIDAEAADMDNDGDLDIVMLLDGVAPAQDSVVILENAGVDGAGEWLGFLANPHTQSLPGDLRSLALGFLNGDVYTDVLVTNYSANIVNVFFNAADETIGLVPAPSVAVSGNPYTISAAQESGLAVDFAVGSESSRLVRHVQNDGTGGFTVGASFSHARAPDVVVLKDIDGDFDSDLVVVRRDFQTGQVRAAVEVRLYDALDQTFGRASETQVGYGTSACEIIDLDGDAALDIITADTTGGRLAILINNADGSSTFRAPSFVPVGVQPRSLVARDLDDDGDADLALLVTPPGGGDRRLRVLRNDLTNGQLILATAIDVSAGDNPALILAHDIDMQGGIDVLSINAASTLPSDGATGASVNVFLSDAGVSLCTADINGDDIVDVSDLIAVIVTWGPCPATCPSDIAPPGGDNVVNVSDLLAVILAWGACP